MNDVQSIINKLQAGEVSSEELLNYMDSKLILVKWNAIFSAVRQGMSNADIIQKLTQIGKSLDNESRIFGTWNNGHFAIVALKMLNSSEASQAYNELLKNLNDEQRIEVKRLVENWTDLIENC